MANVKEQLRQKLTPLNIARVISFSATVASGGLGKYEYDHAQYNLVRSLETGGLALLFSVSLGATLFFLLPRSRRKS